MAGSGSVPILATPVEKKLVVDLLEKNHKEHNVFFSREFHNHFPHTLLSHYALGADEKKLKREWDIEGYLEPMPAYRSWQVNEENWREKIGDRSYYHNYVSFFDQQIQSHGILPTLLRFAFDDALFPCLLAGATHPVIHTSFGVEFNQPIVVAEGLAQACGQKPTMRPLFGNLAENSEKGKSIAEIFEEVHKDASLDGVIRFDDQKKSDTTIEKAGGKIKEWVRQWVVPHDSAGIARCLEELYTGAMQIYATTAFGPRSDNGDIPQEEKHLSLNPQDVKLDFFLLHVLTSALAVRVLVPHLPLPQAVLLLKAHFSAGLLYYIARGRPPMSPTALMAYKPSNKNIDSLATWDDVKKWAVTSDDLHVPKVIRALWIGYDMFESSKRDEANNMWFKAAILTLDHWICMKKDWEMDAIGLDETWH